MDQAEQKLALLEQVIKKAEPSFQVLGKDAVWHQKLLGALMFFNRGYMNDYISTFGSKVYWPSMDRYKDFPEQSFKILAHEFVHIYDYQRCGLWFSISYILPQILGVLAISAIVAIWFSYWFLFLLGFLLFLLPIPAYFRAKWEVRGYTMSMAVNIWRFGSITQYTKDWIAENFTGWGYYKMWPFRNQVNKWLNQAEKQIHTGEIFDDVDKQLPFLLVYKIIKK